MLSVLTVTVYARTQDTAEAMATYTVTFWCSTWSADTHPGFPANVDFSARIGATHTVSADLLAEWYARFRRDRTNGRDRGTSRLRSEFAVAGAAVQQIITGPALSTSPAQVALPALTVSQSHPLVTLVTMIAPSPDLFVGVHDLALLDEAGDRRDEIVVTLYPYDAGTDDGVNYTSPDAEPAVHQVIRQLSGQPPFSTAPIGTLTFTRVQQAYLPIVTQ